MTRAADDKAIDKDLKELSLFLVGVQGTCASEERIAHRNVEELENGTPKEVDLTEKMYQHALKNENEAREASKILRRLEEEIKRLRVQAKTDLHVMGEISKARDSLANKLDADICKEQVPDRLFTSTWRYCDRPMPCKVHGKRGS